VVAVDLLAMPPIEGVTFVQGDFREDAVRDRVLAELGGARAELVLSDMAPNLSGIAAMDQARAMHLAEIALELATACLARGGALLVKVFQGEGLEDYVRELRSRFAAVERRKPEASRARSRELYLLARGYAGI
jgi:23S rRNA (uridine2552-2'-O)-methyltransferase